MNTFNFLKIKLITALQCPNDRNGMEHALEDNCFEDFTTDEFG